LLEDLDPEADPNTVFGRTNNDSDAVTFIILPEVNVGPFAN